ncbi:SDR family NAD(P)-dependent oxidoreductase [Allomuricauda sp. SCSIO 65647]|uniref:SDR family NAD(P)-dependent oxidoreductase n=1 Tax=Allomuricauda sp. SCSIO 65647 TaxID=2908843 RepID=UPI001F31F6DA|nr:SDR family NAD(P)-dependent oxidoreductase [Muricauda sp. SCSIO 65647]UJH67860.1 SDR family NAD(P)-dependent oxidoreductase [Muricauda sp. SCSIO 65647]
MKTILITGSTDGIGKLTALKLAKDGHKILVHGRNPKKVENTVSEIKNNTSSGRTNGLVSDLSDFESIGRMVSNIPESISKIDVLINNAGVFKSSAPSNQDGLDLRFAVNYFAPYLLTNGLLPLLQKSNSPRVINLSSAAQSTVSLTALSGQERISDQKAYAQSKLALTMWSFAFAKKYPEITTIAVNPGSLLNTKMVQEAYGQHWSSADKGAAILYELGVSERFSNHSGQYFDNDKGDFNKAHTDAYDNEKIRRLLTETGKIVGG